MPKLTILVGPPGSGKSTLSKQYVEKGYVRINQDSQGRDGHRELFMEALAKGADIVVDRMNFNKQQREPYLTSARLTSSAPYETEIIVLHESYQTCLERIRNRFGSHETIHDEGGARGALGTFFTKYERPEAPEADKITYVYPEGLKPSAIVVDLDGTLCEVEHRRHHVRPPKNVLVGPDGSMVDVLGKLDPVSIDEELPKFKKNWKAFFAGIPNDTVNQPVADIVRSMSATHRVVFCSGRDSNQRKMTVEWLSNKLWLSENHDYVLYMRDRSDSRQDSIVKENILDFEILTRFTPYFMLDDRDQVVKMWRRRGFKCLQVAEGDF